MTQLFHVEEADTDEETWKRLRTRLSEETWPDGQKMFTVPAVASLLIFFVYALQCLPTSAVVARESGSWKWAAGQFAFMSVFAWVAAFVAYRIALLFF